MELFTSQISEPNRNVLDHVQRRVTTPMNDALMALYTVEEVKKALFSIGDLKARGADGLHVGERCMKKIYAHARSIHGDA